ncbi:MAG: cytochrome c biogenesis protein CcsA [Pseudomonadota bacterium]
MLPVAEVLGDLMHKTIACGFGFFTHYCLYIQCDVGRRSLGRLLSWDTKETWALIVWLNAAAWLHMRMIKGLRGPLLAW